MAEPILASLIHGIASLLTHRVADQARRLLTTGQDVCWLRDELHSMQLFLHEVETCSGDGSATTEAWVHQMRDIMLIRRTSSMSWMLIRCVLAASSVT